MFTGNKSATKGLMKNIFDNDAILARVKALLTSLAKAGGINLCVLDILGDPIVYPTND